MRSDELARALSDAAHEIALEGAARLIEDTQQDDAARARRRRERQQAKGKSDEGRLSPKG